MCVCGGGGGGGGAGGGGGGEKIFYLLEKKKKKKKKKKTIISELVFNSLHIFKFHATLTFKGQRMINRYQLQPYGLID